MKKELSEYKAVVFDLDGTLYYQFRLRIKMAWVLCTYYLCHFWRIKDLFIIKRFREVREHWDEINKGRQDTEDSLESLQYSYLAGKMKVSGDRVRSVIEKWMYERPLEAVHDTRDADLLSLIEEIKKRGQKVFIFSDYPIEDKLKALGLSVDGAYAATDERVNELKPSPRGLKLIMEDTGFSPDEIIMVGDRMSRDGQAAVNAGCDYIILPASRAERKRLYTRGPMR
ncbi:MAG: HAD family hydrolase [Lachnospiraceae bacterium]|nr:HAD family hydrolase [Lachnospiraceae bacterium]